MAVCWVSTPGVVGACDLGEVVVGQFAVHAVDHRAELAGVDEERFAAPVDNPALTPGRYVGAEVGEDDGEPFEDKMQRLTATLRDQQKEAAKLDAAIAANLKELGYGG